MALLNLSLVTEALIRLIRLQVKDSPAWSGAEPPVSPLPPDKVTGGGLGLYLYHLAEEGQYKNLPAPAGNIPPVRYTPMGLNLYYLLSAHSAADDENAYYQSQLLFGLAIKALHDFSILTDSTRLKDREQDKAVRLFEEVGLSGASNRIRLSLQPLPHNEAVSFWTAASLPLRLSAHYQASVILLEPEEPPARAGRVLTYGVYPFVSGAPRLTGSENTLRFTIPGTSTTQAIRLRPAEVPVGSSVMFTGIALTGDETHLLLKNPHWRAPRQADASWSINATVDRITATVQATIDGELIQPGIYAAAARVARFQPTPEGEKRRFEHTSNDTPFTITPRIDGLGEDSNGVRAITGHILYLPARQDGEEPDAYSSRIAGIIERSDIRIFLGTKGLSRVKEFPPAGIDQFMVKPPEPPPGFVTLFIHLSEADRAPRMPLPLRLVVNGAESPPQWLPTP